MAKKNEAKVTFLAETQDFRENVTKANSTLTQIRSELKLNAEQMKTNGSSVDALAERHKLLENQLEQAKSKTANLAAQMDSCTRNYGENSVEAQKLATQINNARAAEEKIQQEINRVNQELSEQEAAAQKTESALDQLESTINDQEATLTKLRREYAATALEFGENSDEASALASEITELSGELNENRDKLKKAQTAAENLGRSMDDIEDGADGAESALDALKATIAKQESALDDLKTAYKNTALEQGDSSKAAQDLAQEISALSKDLKTNRDRLKDAEEAADGFADAGREAAESAEGWTVLKDVIADLASNAVQAAADAFKDLLLNGELALDRLQAKTGTSGEAMDGLGKTAQDVFANGFGESIEDVTEAMSTISTMMGDMDFDHLQGYTENAMTLSDVFGYDVAESIRAVNALEKQFGVDGEEAFNLIVQGAQNGLDQNGDLLDTINEYSVQFKNAGFSADEMFNMLLNGANEGTWSVDKLGDAFKEYNIRVSDGTVADSLMENRKALGLTKKEVNALTESYGKGGDESKAAMKATLDAVMSVEDETERYKLGVSLFGTVWEDLGEDAVVALFDTEGGISSVNDAMAQTKTDAYDNLASSLTTLGRTLKNEIWTPIINLVTPALKGLVDWAIEHMEILTPIIVGVGTAFGVLAGALAISGIISGVQKAFALLNTTLLANPIVLIVALIAGLVAAFIYLWNNCEAFRGFWIGLWENIKTAFSAVKEWFGVACEAVAAFFTGLWDSVCNGATAAIEWIKTTWSTITTWIDTNIIQPIIGFFANMWQGVQTAWDTICNVIQVAVMLIGSIISGAVQIITLPFRFIWENCKGIVIAAWEAIKSGISTAISVVSSVISTTMNVIKTVFSTVWNAIKSVVSTVWNAIKSVVTIAVNAVKEKVSAVWNTLKSITSTAFNAVKSVALSVWNGIKTTITNVVNSVKEKVSAVWNTIKTATSTAFNAVKSVALNVWNGIKTTISNVVNGVKTTVSSVWNGIRSTTASVFNGIKSTATSVWNGIKSAIITPIEAAKDKVKGVIDSIKGFFSGMKLELPHIKLPHFTVTGKLSLNPPSVPKLSIEWYKDGGIMLNPTVFGMNGGNLMAGGEAGAEAIAPISLLLDYVREAVRDVFDMQRNADDLDAVFSHFEKLENHLESNDDGGLARLIDAIEDLASRPINIDIDSMRVATATAGASDAVSGNRFNLKNRGLAL